MSSVICKFLRCQKPSKICVFTRRTISSQPKHTEENVEEVKIPVPWGHIAGSWWGPKSQRPILCLHGWQDNANSFKTLIPHLSPDFSFLAIDLPGHGLSSYLSKGLFYKAHGMLDTIRRIQLHYNWSEVSLMAHSYGAACSFLFASCFPNTVDFFIAIDLIKPMTGDSAKEIKSAPKTIENMLLQDSLNPSNAPLYSKNDLIQRWMKGTNNSITEKSCEILMERGTELRNGLFKLTRDGRVKFSFSTIFTQKELLELAENIICDVLYIKAKDSRDFDKKIDVDQVLKVIRKTAKHFEQHDLPGTHHIHLNTPQVVAPVINSFLKRYNENKN